MAMVHHWDLTPHSRGSLHSSLLLISPCGQACCGNVFLGREYTIICLCESPDAAWVFFGTKSLRKQRNQTSSFGVANVFKGNMRWDRAEDEDIQENKVTSILSPAHFLWVHPLKLRRSDKLKPQLAMLPLPSPQRPDLSICLAITHQFSLKFTLN